MRQIILRWRKKLIENVSQSFTERYTLLNEQFLC
jgi:hypothetical protein